MALVRPRAAVKTRTAEKASRVSSVRKATNTSTMAAAALVDPDKPLTEQQKLYAKYRAEGESVPNAMARAGYNDQPSYGYRMLKMPNVQKLIRQYQQEYAEASKLTKQRVIEMQLEAYDMAKLMADPSAMSKAAREAGLLCGFYEPTKIEITNAAGRKKVEQLSDDELFAEIERLREHGQGEDIPRLEH